jgi:glycosyltransferase involved in cell wall biosynthesis
MSKPRISVIAPAHNAAAFFPAWIESIRGQCYESLEVLLVDDGSSDNLAELAEASANPPIRYLRQDQRGPAAARNAALRAATGEMIAFLDLDDLWAPGHLLRCAEALERRPDAGIAQG